MVRPCEALCPCLTKSRRNGYWHIGRGCRLSGVECLRLQGLASTDIANDHSEPALRALAGNSMSLCVLEPLMRSALIAVGLYDGAKEDRWANGSAQARLVHDAWGSGLPTTICSELPQHVAALLRVGSDHDIGCVKTSLGLTGCHRVLPHDMLSLST